MTVTFTAGYRIVYKKYAIFEPKMVFLARLMVALCSDGDTSTRRKPKAMNYAFFEILQLTSR